MTDTHIQNCKFAYKCNKAWGDLQPTTFAQVRFCNECSRDVFLCTTESELAESVRLGRCVAVGVPTTQRSRSFDEDVDCLIGLVVERFSGNDRGGSR